MLNQSTPSVKRNFILSTAYQFLVLLVPFITAPYISRILGPKGIGIYSFTSSIVSYFVLFATLGTMSYGAREVSRARDNKKLLSKLFWEIELLVVCTTSICLLLWGVWVFLANEYCIIYLVLTFSLLSVVADISWFFRGLELFKYIVLRNSIVKIAGVILLFIFIREPDDLILYIFLITIINFVGAVTMWMYIPKMVDKVDWRTLNIKSHFRETLIYFIPAISTSVYTILNKVLLGFLGTDIRENGFYEQATRIVGIGQVLTFSALNSVLGPRIAYLFSENKIEEIHMRIEKSLNYILLTGFCMSLGLIAIAPRFVPWFFGAGFEPTILLIQLLSPLILIIGVSNCLGDQYYTPAGLRKQSARYIVMGAFVNLILNVLLIPSYGAIGAVIGSLMAELTITVLYLSNCRGFITLRQIIQKGWRKAFAAIMMFIVVSYICSCIGNNTIAIIASSLLGVITYIFILLFLRDELLTVFFHLGLKKIFRR